MTAKLQRKNLMPVTLVLYPVDGGAPIYETIMPRAENGDFALVQFRNDWQIVHAPSGLRVPAFFRTVDFAEEVLRHMPKPEPDDFPSSPPLTRKEAMAAIHEASRNSKDRYEAAFASLGMVKEGALWQRP